MRKVAHRRAPQAGRDRRRRILALWIGFVIFALAAAACQGSTEASSDVELVVWAENQTITSMTAEPDGAGRYGRYVKSQFEKENPGVTIKFEYRGWDEELRQNLVTALIGGGGPDVVVGENFFAQLARMGVLLPLDISDIKDDLIPATYRAGVIDGKVYAISAFTGVFGFERNCAVVEEAGLSCDEAPATWSDLLSQTREITRSGDDRYYGYSLQGPVGFSVGSVLRAAVYLKQADASLCKDDCTQPYFNDPRAIRVYDFLRALEKEAPPGLSFTPDEATVYAQLPKGVSAYQMAGSWHPDRSKQLGCGDCRYSPPPVPEGGHAASLVVGNVAYAAINRSDHPEVAERFVKFLARNDVQELAYPALKRLPSTRAALRDLRPDVDAETQIFIGILLDSDNLGILPQWRDQPQKIWAIWNDMFTKMLTTDIPSRTLMDEAQQRAEIVASTAGQ